MYLNLKVNLSPSKIHCGLSLFLPHLASVVWEINAKVWLRVRGNDVFGEHGILYGGRNFLHPLSNFVCRVYVLLERGVGGDACKFPSPWHKSLDGLLFWELLQRQAIVVGFQILPPALSLSSLLSLGFAWCEVFLMVYVTTTILAEGSWVWLITLWLTKRMNDLIVILQASGMSW